MLSHYIEKIQPLKIHNDTAIKDIANNLKYYLKEDSRFASTERRLENFHRLKDYLSDIMDEDVTLTNDVLDLLKVIREDTETFLAYHAFSLAIKASHQWNEWCSTPFPLDKLKLNKNKMLYIAACYNHVDIFEKLLEENGQLEIADCFKYLSLIGNEGYSSDFANDLNILKLISDYFKTNTEKIQPMEKIPEHGITCIASTLFTENLYGLAKLLLTNCDQKTELFFYFISYIRYQSPTEEMIELFFSPDYFDLNHSTAQLFYLLFPLYAEPLFIMPPPLYSNLSFNNNAKSDYINLINRVIDHPSPVFNLPPDCEDYFFVNAYKHQPEWIDKVFVKKTELFKSGVTKCGLFALGRYEKESVVSALPLEIIHLISKMFFLEIIFEKVTKAVDSQKAENTENTEDLTNLNSVFTQYQLSFLRQAASILLETIQSAQYSNANSSEDEDVYVYESSSNSNDEAAKDNEYSRGNRPRGC